MQIKVYKNTDDSFTRNANGELTELTLSYLVQDAKSHDEAMAKVQELTPKTYENMKFNSTQSSDYENGFYTITANYIASFENSMNIGKPEENPATLSFDCSTASQKMTVARDQKLVGGSTKTDIGNYVGWNGEDLDKEGCEFAGVEFFSPIIRETYTKVFSNSKLNTAFKRRLAGYVGKVNSTKFKGWDGGEVLFMGVSWSGNVAKDAQITVSYHFSVSMNETNIKIGDDTVPKKKGWQYIWSLPEKQKAKEAKKLKILGIWIADIYEETDFNGLGV